MIWEYTKRIWKQEIIEFKRSFRIIKKYFIGGLVFGIGSIYSTWGIFGAVVILVILERKSLFKLAELHRIEREQIKKEVFKKYSIIYKDY